MRHLTWRGERHVYRLDDKPVEPVIVTIKSAVSVGLSFDPWKQRSAVVGNRFDGCSLPVSGSAEPLRRCDSAVTLGSGLLCTHVVLSGKRAPLGARFLAYHVAGPLHPT